LRQPDRKLVREIKNVSRHKIISCHLF